MNLAVRGKRVLVQTEDQSVTECGAGVVLVESYTPDVVGRIVAAGDVEDVKVGDVVLFPPSAGLPMEYGDARYLILEEQELLAVYGESV